MTAISIPIRALFVALCVTMFSYAAAAAPNWHEFSQRGVGVYQAYDIINTQSSAWGYCWWTSNGAVYRYSRDGSFGQVRDADPRAIYSCAAQVDKSSFLMARSLSTSIFQNFDIEYSTDNGATWRTLFRADTGLCNAYDIKVLSRDSWWLTTEFKGVGALLSTSDAGAHWLQDAMPHEIPAACMCVDGSSVVVAAKGGVITWFDTTTHVTETLERSSTMFPRDMIVRGDTLFLASTSQMAYSTDRGLSWSENPAPQGSMRPIYLLNAHSALVCTETGLAFTNDGGATWQYDTVATATRSYQAMAVVEANDSHWLVIAKAADSDSSWIVERSPTNAVSEGGAGSGGDFDTLQHGIVFVYAAALQQQLSDSGLELLAEDELHVYDSNGCRCWCGTTTRLPALSVACGRYYLQQVRTHRVRTLLKID